MSAKLNKLKNDLKTAKEEEVNAQKAHEEASTDEDKKAASDLLETASKTVSDIEAEIEKLVAASKSQQGSKRNQSAQKADKNKNTGPAVEVSCAISRRRAGLKFGPVPVTIFRDDITDEQWKAIDNDPMLKVSPAKQPN